MVIANNRVNDKLERKITKKISPDYGNIWGRQIRDKEVSRIVKIHIPLAKFIFATTHRTKTLVNDNRSMR